MKAVAEASSLSLENTGKMAVLPGHNADFREMGDGGDGIHCGSVTERRFD